MPLANTYKQTIDSFLVPVTHHPNQSWSLPLIRNRQCRCVSCPVNLIDPKEGPWFDLFVSRIFLLTIAWTLKTICLCLCNARKRHPPQVLDILCTLFHKHLRDLGFTKVLPTRRYKPPHFSPFITIMQPHVIFMTPPAIEHLQPLESNWLKDTDSSLALGHTPHHPKCVPLHRIFWPSPFPTLWRHTWTRQAKRSTFLWFLKRLKKVPPGANMVCCT